MKNRPLFYVVVWVVILFVFSSDFFSYYATRKIVKGALLWVDPDMSMATILNIHKNLRKLVHVLNYMVLSWLILCALTRSFRPLKKWTPKLGVASFLLCLAYSLVDEWRQSFSAIRTPAGLDIALDAIGAFAVQMGAMLWSVRTKQAPSEKS